MDGRADGRMDGWADGRTGGRMDGRADGRTDNMQNVRTLQNYMIFRKCGLRLHAKDKKSK